MYRRFIFYDNSKFGSALSENSIFPTILRVQIGNIVLLSTSYSRIAINTDNRSITRPYNRIR